VKLLLIFSLLRHEQNILNSQLTYSLLCINNGHFFTPINRRSPGYKCRVSVSHNIHLFYINRCPQRFVFLNPFEPVKIRVIQMKRPSLELATPETLTQAWEHFEFPVPLFRYCQEAQQPPSYIHFFIFLICNQISLYPKYQGLLLLPSICTFRFLMLLFLARYP
jgi:hypothetical protein